MPQTRSMQQSSTDIVVGDNAPPSKKTRVDDEDLEGCEDVQAPLVTLLEAASAFLEAAFETKLENKIRVAKANVQGMPDS